MTEIEERMERRKTEREKLLKQQENREIWKRSRAHWRSRMQFLLEMWESAKVHGMSSTGDKATDNEIVAAWGDWRTQAKAECKIAEPPEPGVEHEATKPTIRESLREAEVASYTEATKKLDANLGEYIIKYEGKIDARLKIAGFNEVLGELRKYEASEECESWYAALQDWRERHMSKWSKDAVAQVRIKLADDDQLSCCSNITLSDFIWKQWGTLTGTGKLKHIIQLLRGRVVISSFEL